MEKAINFDDEEVNVEIDYLAELYEELPKELRDSLRANLPWTTFRKYFMPILPLRLNTLCI